MLNKTERYKILESWKLFCIVGQFPAQVDLKNWELKSLSNRKQWICAASFGLFVLHSLFKTGTLIHAYFFLSGIPLHQLIIHAIVALSGVMCAVWYCVAYVQDPKLFAAYVKMTLLGNVGGTPELKDGFRTHWARRLREYSLQDLIAMSSPYLVSLVAPAISASYIYDPSMRLLLFAALPNHLQNWATFGLLLLEEIRFLLVMNAVVTPIWQLHVISFDLVINRLLVLMQKIEKGKLRTGSVYMRLRSLQLYVSTFNTVNSYLIFTWKLTSISMCIMSGYAAMAHFHQFPIFGIMYYVILLDCSFCYAIIYEKAFKIPQSFDQAASCALLRVGARRKDSFRRQILSIPPTGINVGHFHKMERTSTLIFMNYVLTNIVNMLVAYG